MFQPMDYDMFSGNSVNKHIMAGNKCSSELGVLTAFKTEKRLFQEKL